MAEKPKNVIPAGLDKAVVMSFVNRLQGLDDAMASRKSDYMTDCKSIKADIKTVYEDAKKKGLAPKALKRVLKQLNLEARIDNLTEGMDIDERSQFDMMLQALGMLADTPLGSAALKAVA